MLQKYGNVVFDVATGLYCQQSGSFASFGRDPECQLIFTHILGFWTPAISRDGAPCVILGACNHPYRQRFNQAHSGQIFAEQNPTCQLTFMRKICILRFLEIQPANDPVSALSLHHSFAEWPCRSCRVTGFVIHISRV